MTAEFAVAVPAVLLVLAACLGGLRLGVERLRVVDAAAQVARATARGDADAAAAVPPGARVRSVARRGDLVCVQVGADVPLLGLPVPVTGSSCSLAALRP